MAIVVPLVTLPAGDAEAAFATPSLVRTIGGTGRAAVFPWGMAYDAVSNELVVSDYLNYQVRLYATDGTYLGDLPQPTGDDGSTDSVLASVAVDPTNGDIYIAKPRQINTNGTGAACSTSGNTTCYDYVAHYDAQGNRLADIPLQQASGCPITVPWITTDQSGNIYALDSGLGASTTCPSRLIKLAAGGSSVVWTIPLLFPNQLPTQAYGLGVSAAGRIYISDSINRRIQMIAPDGSYWGSFGSGGDAGTVGALSGDLRSVLVDDALGRVFVVDALQSQIEVYTLAGDPVYHFGGEGSGPGQLTGPRQLALDSQGHLWVTEYGNYRMQEFDVAGDVATSLLTAPTPSPAPPAGQLGQPRDIAIDPATGNLWVSDSWNERFQEFAPDGSLLGTWGHRGSSPPYGMKYPRGIGFDPVNRRVWVTNNAAGTIYVYDDHANFITQLGLESNRRSAQAGFFEKPEAVTFGGGAGGNDYAYVTDPGSQYPGDTPIIKILDPVTFAQVGTIPGNSTGVTVDPASGNVYVALAGGKVSVFPATGGKTALASFGTKGSGNGQFQTPWDVEIIGDTAYVSDEAISRIQAFSITRPNPPTGKPTFAFLGKWGGFGMNPYQFENPSGMATDANGLLYVADAANDRIEVFNPAVPRPAYEFSRPTITLQQPATGSFVDAPVTFSGTATDNVAVANVEVSVKDLSTGLWWQPTMGVWQPTQVWGIAPYAGATPKSVTWSWTFDGASYGHDYHLEVRSRDTNNTLSVAPAMTDIHVRKLVGDTTPPQLQLATPTDGSVFAPGPVLVSGTASDDVGVASIKVSVQHVATGQWWTGSAWSITQTWLSVTPDSPGASSTTWTWSWTPPSAGGFSVQARSVDLVGNTSDVSSAGFTIDPGVPDTVQPDTTLSFPKNNQTVPFGPITFAGTATDNVGVADVQVAIKNRVTGLWWKASTSTWVTAFTWNAGSTLATPGASPTGWTYAWTPPSTGTYAVTARAVDATNNIDPTRPYNNFSVS